MVDTILSLLKDLIFVLGRVENIARKREKASEPSFVFLLFLLL